MHTPRLGGEDSHQQAGFEREQLGLVPIRVARWLDFIFVNLDGKAPPFDEHIAPLQELLAPYDLSTLRPADRWTLEYPGNWKISVEGAIEDYHIPIGHPRLMQSVRSHNARLYYADACFYATSAAREYYDAAATNPIVGAGSGPQKFRSAVKANRRALIL